MSVRPEHKPRGEPCSKCGLPAARHRQRRRDSRERKAYVKAYNASYDRGPRRIVAIDGEGYTDKKGKHRYTYMAAADKDGLIADLYDPNGLRFEQVADWLLDRLPRGAMLVGFSLGYDRTKWLESLSDKAIWAVMHPEARQGRNGPRPVRVKTPAEIYRVNLVSSLFTVKRESDGARQRVWDLFKFFQSSFVVALDKWKIGEEIERNLIAAMKAKRGSFRGITDREKEYCVSECILLAKLTHALLEAHEAEDLHLRHYYGPGSSAALVLEACGAVEQNAVIPPLMAIAVNSAYFGGRFEDSRVGPVLGKIYGYDIASAYPYALALLPCFAHGRWEWREKYKGEPWACVRYEIEPHINACTSWGPLPHRLPDGNIVYPISSAGGWAWSVELLPAMKLHPGIKTSGAWVWRQTCRHPPPFQKKIRYLFERRKQWGKASRGIVLKLALNSMYGKSAQRVGSGKFRCMVRAGLITATTRGMLLEAILRAKDPSSILELATDSVLSTEPLDLPSSPFGDLGSWEAKHDHRPGKGYRAWKGGAFLLRPGLRFDLGKTLEDMTHTAARGLGVRVLHANRQKVIRRWKREPLAPVHVQQPSFFHGARASIRRVRGPVDINGDQGYLYRRDALYGQWVTPTPRQVRYSPFPKRTAVLEGFRLAPHELPRVPECRSVPYGDAPSSPLGDSLEELRAFSEEQDGGEKIALF